MFKTEVFTQDRAIEKVRRAIDTYGLIPENSPVIVGLSGGADSAFLVYALYKLRYEMICVHVEHGMRPNDSSSDSLSVHKLCERFGAKLFIEHIEINEKKLKHKESVETVARNERYKIFEKYSKEYNDAPIAVAHHANDQVETILINIARGCGLRGLCGMRYKNGNIIRPMLDVNRYEVENYNYTYDIPCVTDSTNYYYNLVRNNIRHLILTETCKTFECNLTDKITSLSETMHDYREYFENLMDEYQKDFQYDDYCLYFKIDEKLPRIVFIELIQRAINVLNGNILDLSKAHLFEIYNLAHGASGKLIQLPNGIMIKKCNEKLVFIKPVPYVGFEFTFKPERSYPWQTHFLRSKFVDKLEKKTRILYYDIKKVRANSFECIDFDKLPKSDLKIRTRRPKDFIYPLGAEGKCTLKKLMIDKKYPEYTRDFVPVLAHKNEILAVIGVTVSEKVKVDENTKRIIKIYEEF
jgi:tRNA(Ile)-lysidine synthase